MDGEKTEQRFYYYGDVTLVAWAEKYMGLQCIKEPVVIEAGENCFRMPTGWYWLTPESARALEYIPED
jgi:hypothetical protein